ncbi:sensor histidine kinase [Nakamurella sp.]|uniref:sensor histidine kinase n=1 Tax=Nakamurella sp. TaxID=1869182 RepID=UPI003B3A6801
MTARAVAAQAATLLVVVAAVVGIYLAVLLGTGSSMDHPPSGVSLVLATVVVAVLLQPVYRRSRRWWRRRLAVADPPLDLVRQLPRSLAAQVPAEQLPGHMVRLLTEALRVRRAELWLQVDGQRQLAAAWPPGPAAGPSTGAAPEAAAGPSAGRAPDEPVEVHPIRHSGVEVGRLVLLDPHAERRSTVENRLLATYADQAGEVLVMLARQESLRQREAELARQAARLRAARSAQLVAERAERRQIERDLHDGAQQQLIALGLAVRLAARTADRSPDRTRAALADAAGLARRTGAELGRISRSLYPAALDPAPDPADPAAGDLTAALRDAAARLPIPIILTADPPDAGTRAGLRGRTALYFVVLEAIQNAAKHAAPSRIEVRIEHTGDRLTVRVRDDGRGFDPAVAPAGTGLANARARLDDVGGTLTVAAAPGAGTVLTAGVPATALGPVARAVPDVPGGTVNQVVPAIPVGAAAPASSARALLPPPLSPPAASARALPPPDAPPPDAPAPVVLPAPDGASPDGPAGVPERPDADPTAA